MNYQQRQQCELIRTYLLSIVALVIFGLIIYCAENVFSGVVESATKETKNLADIVPYLVAFLGLVVVQFYILRLATRRIKILDSTAHMSELSKAPKHRHLVLGYSPLPEILDPDNSGNSKIEFVTALISDIHEERVDPMEIASNKKSFKAYAENNEFADRHKLPWQQTIRMLNRHGTNLKSIYLLRADDDDDLHNYFVRYLRANLDQIAPEACIKTISLPGTQDEQAFYLVREFNASPRSYLSYEYVYEGICRGLEMISRDHQAIDSDICVDATPGQKPYSIAAAVVTLNRDLTFGYVDPNGIVRFYDAGVSVSHLFGTVNP